MTVRGGSARASAMTDAAVAAAEPPPRTRILLGVAAYGIWGVLPLFLHQLSGVPALQVVAHRILWSLALLVIVAVAGGRLRGVIAAARRWRVLALLCGTAVLIAANWSIYASAVLNHHVVEASLGYFINPLLNVLLGVAILKERLRPVQWIAVGIAAAGVAVMAARAGAVLAIPLGIAASFAFYGLLRKMAPVDAFGGLIIESALLAPFALAFLVRAAHLGVAAWGPDISRDLLLMLTGPFTAVPLLLFAAAAKRMRYTTLGLLQYMAPTLQLLEGVLVLGERLTPVHLVTFGCIWAGLLLYAVDGVRAARRAGTPIPE